MSLLLTILSALVVVVALLLIEGLATELQARPRERPGKPWAVE